MSVSNSGRSPVVGPLVAATLMSVFLALLLGGCASNKASTSQSYWQSPQSRVAGYVAGQSAAQYSTDPGAHPQAILIEDDGLPAQIAPPKREPRRDDPTEPFSPNYGRAPVLQKADLQTEYLPEDLPPAFRRELLRSRHQ